MQVMSLTMVSNRNIATTADRNPDTSTTISTSATMPQLPIDEIYQNYKDEKESNISGAIQLHPYIHDSINKANQWYRNQTNQSSELSLQPSHSDESFTETDLMTVFRDYRIYDYQISIHHIFQNDIYIHSYQHDVEAERLKSYWHNELLPSLESDESVWNDEIDMQINEWNDAIAAEEKRRIDIQAKIDANKRAAEERKIQKAADRQRERERQRQVEMLEQETRHNLQQQHTIQSQHCMEQQQNSTATYTSQAAAAHVQREALLERQRRSSVSVTSGSVSTMPLPKSTPGAYPSPKPIRPQYVTSLYRRHTAPLHGQQPALEVEDSIPLRPPHSHHPAKQQRHTTQASASSLPPLEQHATHVAHNYSSPYQQHHYQQQQLQNQAPTHQNSRPRQQQQHPQQTHGGQIGATASRAQSVVPIATANGAPHTSLPINNINAFLSEDEDERKHQAKLEKQRRMMQRQQQHQRQQSSSRSSAPPPQFQLSLPQQASASTSASSSAVPSPIQFSLQHHSHPQQPAPQTLTNPRKRALTEVIEISDNEDDKGDNVSNNRNVNSNASMVNRFHSQPRQPNLPGFLNARQVAAQQQYPHQLQQHLYHKSHTTTPPRQPFINAQQYPFQQLQPQQRQPRQTHGTTSGKINNSSQVTEAEMLRVAEQMGC